MCQLLTDFHCLHAALTSKNQLYLYNISLHFIDLKRWRDETVRVYVAEPHGDTDISWQNTDNYPEALTVPFAAEGIRIHSTLMNDLQAVQNLRNFFWRCRTLLDQREIQNPGCRWGKDPRGSFFRLLSRIHANRLFHWHTGMYDQQGPNSEEMREGGIYASVRH